MKNHFTISILLVLLSAIPCFAQKSGILQGTVKDKTSQERIYFATVAVLGTTPMKSTETDSLGNFQLNLPIGTYNLQTSFVGYETITTYNVDITTGNVNTTTIEMVENSSNTKEVVVNSNKMIRVATLESPNSIQRLGIQEIKSNPGGNFDVFKVVQSLPGVGAPAGVGNRNDMVIRGGSPGENAYYLDGIEIPVINHFATQGASGGSNGILNVSFIDELTLNSSAFDAKYDNALSSVFQFKQKEGNSKKIQGNVRMSSSELAATLEGPIDPKTTFLASARRSYLQYLFQAIDLAIRPNYWDFQYKVTHKLNNKTTITAIGLGAIDDFYTEITKNTNATNAYIIKSTPVIKQWNYTRGFTLKHLLDDGIVNIALSRNMADNTFTRFEDGLRDDPTKQTLASKSQEIENKLRVSVTKFKDKWTLSYGATAQYVKYNNNFSSILQKTITDNNGNVLQPAISINFGTKIDFAKYGLFGQVSHRFLDNKLSVSLGIRTDGNTFTEGGNNPINALSPRIALAYTINDKWKVSASVGQYAKLPSYTILGYRDAAGSLVNKNAKYIHSTHYVIGTEFIPRESSRFTVEAFYKKYANYPISVRDGISIANQGSDFGFIGNEAVVSSGKGTATGIEFFFQQKLTKNLFAFVSYTYVVSKFSGKDNKLIASAWDNRHLLSATLGRKFKKGWEIGMKYRFAGGTPYTPFDLQASQLNYGTFGTGVLDYTKINTKRLKPFQQFDFRVDKKMNFKKTTLDIYLDVTNALLFKKYDLPNYVFERTTDNTAFATTDGQALQQDGSNAVPKILNEPQLTVIPSLGFIIEF